MGRLAGFRYREVVRKLKLFGFEFDRQAAGSHEIWFNARANLYTTVPNHPCCWDSGRCQSGGDRYCRR